MVCMICNSLHGLHEVVVVVLVVVVAMVVGLAAAFNLNLGCRSSSHWCSCQHGKGNESGGIFGCRRVGRSDRLHETGHLRMLATHAEKHEKGSQEACHESSDEEGLPGQEGHQEEVSSWRCCRERGIVCRVLSSKKRGGIREGRRGEVGRRWGTGGWDGAGWCCG